MISYRSLSSQSDGFLSSGSSISFGGFTGGLKLQQQSNAYLQFENVKKIVTKKWKQKKSLNN